MYATQSHCYSTFGNTVNQGPNPMKKELRDSKKPSKISEGGQNRLELELLPYRSESEFAVLYSKLDAI